MIFLFGNALGLLAIVVAFYFPIASWILLALPGAYLFAVYRILKGRRLRAAIPQLSPQANELLVNSPHFYTNPSANRPIGGAAGVLALAGVIVAIVGCFRDFWWGLIIGLVYLGVMAKLTRAFTPSIFLRDENQKRAHNEIMAFLANRGRL